MKTRRHVPAGSLLAGAAAFLFTAAIAVGANPDPKEASEAEQMDVLASAQGSAQVTDRLSDRFATFAGSEDNATALVNGLRDGTAINLTSTADGQTTTTTFTPPTGKIGFGNVFLSLALAEEQLTKLGITQPTPDQIQAALDGGSVTTGSGSTATTTQLTGVLVLRNQGQGWGQISQSLGVNLGSAIRDARAGSDANETAEAGQMEEMAKTQGSARVTDKLSDRFATFAGGEANATALVNGLRDGTAINLITTANGQTTTTTFAPPTGHMGYGNVFLSLQLAQEELAKLGITQPTPDQIEAALDGGSVTTGSGSTAITTQLTGVLVLRSQGQGWGQIAQTLGVNLRSAEQMEMHVADATDHDKASHEKAMENESQSTANVSPHAIAAASTHPDTAASLHTDLASSAHPDVSAASSRPDIGAGARPEVGISARPEPVSVRPEIPVRPVRPGSH